MKNKKAEKSVLSPNFLRLIDQLSRQFTQPLVFLDEVRKSDSIPNGSFFNNSKYKPFREAWCAGYFALGLKQLYPSIEVKLVPDRFPDFYIRINGNEYEFEQTTTDKPERKISEEYRDKENNPYLTTPYQPARGREEGPAWIANKVRGKFEKRYSNHPHLLVYANFEADSLNPIVIADSCSQWSDAFGSIWGLWNYQYLQVCDSKVFGKTDYIWHSVGVNPFHDLFEKSE
jgi:hypothetical protein